MDKGKGSSPAPRVVVVGGGVAGALLARSMQHRSDVVLIDPKGYFEIPWAELRSMVEPSFAERSLIYHTDYLTEARTVTSAAVGIDGHHVLTADGNMVEYDYLVIAAGHATSAPVTRQNRIEQFRTENEKIKFARSVLIIGGGPTGVELAGEIAVDYPEKKIILVHRGRRLLEFIGEKASKKALEWLTSKNVDVLLGQSVDLEEADPNIYTTSAGEKITADCHFLCVGKSLSSSWMADSVLKDSLDKGGRLQVDSHLRVRGHKNIFAIGDITDIPEIKQGYLAQRHAEVVAKNLTLLMNGATESKLVTYVAAAYPLAIVSLGRRDAVAQFPCITLSGCIPGKIKSGDLFVGKTRKMMGLKA